MTKFCIFICIGYNVQFNALSFLIKIYSYNIYLRDLIVTLCHVVQKEHGVTD